MSFSAAEAPRQDRRHRVDVVERQTGVVVVDIVDGRHRQSVVIFQTVVRRSVLGQVVDAVGRRRDTRGDQHRRVRVHGDRTASGHAVRVQSGRRKRTGSRHAEQPSARHYCRTRSVPPNTPKPSLSPRNTSGSRRFIRRVSE